MVRLVGEVSDGVGIGIMSSVEFVREIVRPNAREGAKAAGNDPDLLSFPAAATVSINDEVEEAYAASRALFVSFSTRFRTHIAIHNSGSLDLMNLLIRRRNLCLKVGQEAMALVPDEVIEKLTITGPLDDCVPR